MKKQVKVGGLTLGDGKIYIQSMLNRPAEDVEGSVRQAEELEKAGCEIVRAAIPHCSDVRLIPAIKERVNIPLVADIHFDYKAAIACAGDVGILDGDDDVVEVELFQQVDMVQSALHHCFRHGSYRA